MDYSRTILISKTHALALQAMLNADHEVPVKEEILLPLMAQFPRDVEMEIKVIHSTHPMVEISLIENGEPVFKTAGRKEILGEYHVEYKGVVYHTDVKAVN